MPLARSSASDFSGAGPNPATSPRHQAVSAPRPAMSASVARNARWFAYTPPNAASRVTPRGVAGIWRSAVRARHAGHPARDARRVRERERPRAGYERVGHPASGLVHEQRTDVDPATRHRPARAALEPVRIERLARQRRQRLRAGPATGARDLAPEPEHGQELDARHPHALAGEHRDAALGERA